MHQKKIVFIGPLTLLQPLITNFSHQNLSNRSAPQDVLNLIQKEKKKKKKRVKVWVEILVKLSHNTSFLLLEVRNYPTTHPSFSWK